MGRKIKHEVGGRESILNRIVQEDLSTEMVFEWTPSENGGGRFQRKSSQGTHTSRQALGMCLACSENSQEARVAGAE